MHVNSATAVFAKIEKCNKSARKVQRTDGRKTKSHVQHQTQYAILLVAVKPQEGGTKRKVLKMAQIEYIKHLYECEGKSLRKIAKEVGMNFRTVRKYAHMNNFSPPIQPNVEPENYPTLGPCIPAINEWMEQDMREPRKQRHTAKWVYDRLREEQGFRGSYASVKRYVAKKRWLLQQAREGYLPLAQPPGHAQVDFGKFKYYGLPW
jgi:hypothetical protein